MSTDQVKYDPIGLGRKAPYLNANDWLQQVSDAENEVFEEMGFEGSEPYCGSVLSPKLLGLRRTLSPPDSEWCLQPDTYAYKLAKGEEIVNNHAKMAGGGWD